MRTNGGAAMHVEGMWREINFPEIFKKQLANQDRLAKMVERVRIFPTLIVFESSNPASAKSKL